MSAPLTGGLGPNLVLQGGYIVRVTALDPATGATNTDVVISDVALQVDMAEQAPEPPAAPTLPPLLAYEPLG